jgi:hypothetical protein
MSGDRILIPNEELLRLTQHGLIEPITPMV